MTSFSDFLAQHDADDAANAAALAQAKVDVAAAERELNDSEQKLAQVTEDFAAYRESHPDNPAPKVIYGANYGFTADESRFGDLPDAARVYLQTLPASVRTKDHERAYAAGERVFLVSHTDDSDDRLTAILKTCREDCVYYFVSKHEPEDDIEDKKLTLATWLSRQKRHSQIVRSAGHKFGCVLMAFTLFGGNGRKVSDYMLPGVFDFVGVDFYPDKGSGTSAQVVAKLCDLATSAGANEIVIGEFGVRGGAANAVSLINDFRAAFVSKPDGPRATVACYWSTDVYVFTDATRDAWFSPA